MPISFRYGGFEEEFDLKLRNPRDKFSRKEIEYLRKYGKWLWHLTCGTIPPVSPNSNNPDAHFVKVFREKVAEPNDKRERLWKKYLLALDEEQELKRRELEEFRDSPEFKDHIDSLWIGEALVHE